MLKQQLVNLIPVNMKLEDFPILTDEDQIKEVFEEAKNEKSIIIYTIVIEKLRNYVIEIGKKYNIPVSRFNDSSLRCFTTVLALSQRGNQEL